MQVFFREVKRRGWIRGWREVKCGNAPRKTDRLRRFFGTTIIVVVIVTLFSSVTPSIYSDSSEVGIRNYSVDIYI